MDVIKRLANDFSFEFSRAGNNLETMEQELSSKLLSIRKNGEKLRFLSYLNDIAEQQYKSHAPDCKNPENCNINQYLETSLYAIRQQYDEYLEIEGALEIVEKPAMKFFNDGQYFDAYSSIKEILVKAKKEIIIIDGYVDHNTLATLPSKGPETSLKILTSERSINSEFNRSVELYKKQYENIEVFTSNKFHDRFLIIDGTEYYHFGASLKDAGNKTFMYSQINDSEIKHLLNQKIAADLQKN